MFTEFGATVFNQTMAFDEIQVLNDNYKYLISTLELEGLQIKASEEAEDKIQEECCPGEPFLVLSAEVPLNQNES